MAKGGFPGGMGNMNNMMKQAQKMQQEMMKLQQEIEQRTIEASAGGGAINVVIKGNKQIQSIVIKPEVVDPDDVEMLQDLVMAAVNEAIRQVEEMMAREMGKFTGGMNLPGGLF